MTTQIILNISEEALETAHHLASGLGRPVEDLLAENIEMTYRPLGAAVESRPVSAWSDEEVLQATQAEMTPENDRRLSELLSRQQGGAVAGHEQSELQALMQLYQSKLLRKAQALSEAVRRGLRGRLEP